jgi:glutamate N-acetyltransferase / amino-acid N-acetyltransferase
MEWRTVDGGVTAARHYDAGAVRCGIKDGGAKLDLGVVVSRRPAVLAGVFTRNRAAAAPVIIGRRRVARGVGSVVLVNSGNANACTGAQGLKDAEAMCTAAASRFGVQGEDVIVLSTGVIGVPLPMDRLLDGVSRLQPTDASGGDFAHAIMTTDTRHKEAAVEADCRGVAVRIGGAAKGAGMIHPNMATLLGILTTDAGAAGPFLQAALANAVERSFNMISVDGDTSTNDSVVLLANGAAGGAIIDAGSPEAAAFEAALGAVCIDLAKQLVRDAEGARTLIEVQVTGAPSESDARQIARAISSSSLVKTAVFGGDPNWGRVLCAAGYAGDALDPDRATLFLNDIRLFDRGIGVSFSRDSASRMLRQPDVRLALDLGRGDASATAWGCDMSYDYVKINADYTT